MENDDMPPAGPEPAPATGYELRVRITWGLREDAFEFVPRAEEEKAPGFPLPSLSSGFGLGPPRESPPDFGELDPEELGQPTDFGEVSPDELSLHPELNERQEPEDAVSPDHFLETGFDDIVL